MVASGKKRKKRVWERVAEGISTTSVIFSFFLTEIKYLKYTTGYLPFKILVCYILYFSVHIKYLYKFFLRTVLRN